MVVARPLTSTKPPRWDLLLVAFALAHGGLVLLLPSIPIIAIGLWWNANSVSHNFIHRRFFRARVPNAMFSVYLSLLLGLPQSLWRARHLRHHGTGARLEWRQASLDLTALIAGWVALLVLAPSFSLRVYLPGILIGMALCYLQGHYEHARGTVSNYGKLYNLLFFNDGYHIEHHASPGIHWRELPRHRAEKGSVSRWPAVLRWLECVNLCALERMVLRWPLLQRFILRCHEEAFRRLLPQLPLPRRIGIVGGGLFPRTAIILRRLLPESKLVLIDLSAGNLEVARSFVEGDAEYVNKRFEPEAPGDFDLLTIPLAFNDDRRAIYSEPSAPAVLVHDWIWRKRGSSVIVSWFLLKRLNLVKR